MMSFAKNNNNNSNTQASQNPAHWGPPEAPLYMPVQNLTPASNRPKLAMQSRNFLTLFRNGSRAGI